MFECAAIKGIDILGDTGGLNAIYLLDIDRVK